MFQPGSKVITAITQTDPIVVTTSLVHRYIDGMIVRLLVPEEYGMPQANNLVGEITVTGVQNFSLSVNGSLFQAFVVPVTVPLTPAQVVPVGENNGILTAACQNVLPGTTL